MPNALQARSPTETARLQSELERLNTCLRIASASEVQRALLILFSAFPSQDKGDGEDLRIHAYELAIGEVSRFVLDGVIRDVLQGRFDDINRAYLPTPAQLAKLCRDRMGDLRGEEMQCSRLMLSDGRDGLEKFDERPSPESVARIEAKIAAFKRGAPRIPVRPKEGGFRALGGDVQDAVEAMASRSRMWR